MLLLAVAAFVGQSVAPPELLLLGRAKTQMAASLSRMPNYTCLQTIERSMRLPRRKKFELIDVLRLEVGLVEGKELFAWPGSGKFEDKDLVDLVPPGGAIGNGSFAAHAASVFQGHSASIVFDEWEDTPRRARFKYRVPQNLSGYRIRNGSKIEAIIGYHGFFWVDPSNDRVTRIEVEGDDVPPVLGVLNTGSSIDYSSVRIGETDYWLPVGSSMKITNIDNAEYRNDVTFTGCRQFAGESSLRFDDPTPEESAAPVASAPETVTLPKHIYFAIQLDQPLKWGSTVTGEKVLATLSGGIKHRGQVVFSKAAKVEGRVTNLQAVGTGQMMEIQWETIVEGNRSAPFRASSMDRSMASVSRGMPNRVTDREIAGVSGRPGAVLVFTMRGKTDIPKGFRLNWATLE
jgi:hypothetical protein